MIKGLLAVVKSLPSVYESELVTSFFSASSRVASFILQPLGSSFLLKSVLTFPWKSIVIFFFIFSIILSPDSSLQLTSFSSEGLDSTSVINDKQFGLPIFSPMNALLLVLFFVFLKDISSRRKTLQFYSFEVLLAVFFLMAQLSVFMSYNMESAFVWLLKILFGFAIYFIFSRLKLTKKNLQIVFYAFLAIVFVNVLLALVQFIRGGLVGVPFENIRTIIPAERLYFQGTDYFRAVGLLSHPNKLSIYLAMLTPILIALWFHINKKVQILSKVAFLACVFLPLIVLSRWGLVTVVFATAFTLVLFNKLLVFPFHKMAAMAKMLIPVGFSLILLALSNEVIFMRFSQFFLEDKSLAARLELFSQSLYIIREHPLLGIGGGNFSSFLLNYDITQSSIAERFPAPVHSFYLLLMSELGIPAFFILAGSLTLFTRLFFSKVGFLPKRERVMALALFVSLAVFFFNNIWTLNSFDNRAGFLFFLLFGLLVNILSQNNKARSYQ